MRLKDKVAIITGAGSGFGAGMAERFAQEGARVVCADIVKDAAATVASRIGGLAIAADVSRKTDVDDMVAATVERFGGLDILVNNAAISHKNGPLDSVDEAFFDRMMAVNVKSIYLGVLAAVPHLAARGGGSILNIGSTAGIRPRPGLTWYNATKGAVNLMSKSLALDLAPQNIRVNCIAPVIGSTGMTHLFMGMDDIPENRGRFEATIPLGRYSTPGDIASAAVWLCSDEANFITGVELPVDGGRTV